MRNIASGTAPIFATLACHTDRQNHKHPSYARTCPVKVTHPSSKKTVTGLAIIDDQSAITFMDPKVLTWLQVHQSNITAANLSTLTVQGTSANAPC